MPRPLPRHQRRNPIGLFEENYRLLQALLPAWEEGETLQRLGSVDNERVLEVELRDRGPYTTMLALKMPFSSAGVALPELRMELRLYHDARVAEVTTYQGCRHIPAPYQVAGHGRWQVDEKRQVNLLLHELLRYCQRNDFASLTAQDCR